MWGDLVNRRLNLLVVDVVKDTEKRTENKRLTTLILVLSSEIVAKGAWRALCFPFEKTAEIGRVFKI